MKNLLQTIEKTLHFLVILSKGSLDAERCARDADWLRRESAHAILTGRNIVLVLLQDFRMPQTEQLPDELRELPRYNGMPYDHRCFDAFAADLVKFV